MDEFHDSKVAIPIQRNYRKVRSKKNTGSSIHTSRNAKIPSDRRNGHITKQQDYSNRMHNGFRTKSAAARNQPSHRRKNSGRDSPRISKINYSNRLYFDKRRAEGAMRPTKAQPRYIRLEASELCSLPHAVSSINFFFHTSKTNRFAHDGRTQRENEHNLVPVVNGLSDPS
ncbi:hypothetical protein Tco_0192879 [Tanacetum coccineum]